MNPSILYLKEVRGTPLAMLLFSSEHQLMTRTNIDLNKEGVIVFKSL